MKIELTPSQAAKARPLLRDCAGMLIPRVVLGQLVSGHWRDGPDKIFLHYTTIRPETALKVRRLIESEREALAKTHEQTQS